MPAAMSLAAAARSALLGPTVRPTVRKVVGVLVWNEATVQVGWVSAGLAGRLMEAPCAGPGAVGLGLKTAR
jgi:hypothetical protein